MIEFEEKEGQLIRLCTHEWTCWHSDPTRYDVQRRFCLKCKAESFLVPRGVDIEERSSYIPYKEPTILEKLLAYFLGFLLAIFIIWVFKLLF